MFLWYFVHILFGNKHDWLIDFLKIFLEVYWCSAQWSNMIGITFVFYSFCISILRSWYIKILSSPLCLTFQSRGTATSIIVVIRFVLPITTISGVTLSVRSSKSHNIHFLILCYRLWVMVPRCFNPCFNPIMLTYIPVSNCGNIVVCFQLIACSQFVAHIQYMRQHFIGFITHAAFGIFIYSNYLCLLTISVKSLVLSGCYQSFSLYFRLHSCSHLKALLLLMISVIFAWHWPCNCLLFHSWMQSLFHILFQDSLSNYDTWYLLVCHAVFSNGSVKRLLFIYSWSAISLT